jgi:uncharacterized protein YkwD
MTLNRWRVLACAIVIAASSVVVTDQPLVTVANNAPAAPPVVVAMANPPRVLDAIKPPVMTGAENPSAATAEPPVIATTNPPPSPAATPPAVTAAEEAPAVARPANPPAGTANAPSAPTTSRAVIVAKNPPPVTDTITPPVVAGAADASAVRSAANPPVVETKKPAPAFDLRILAVHNRERENLGLAPLNWNPALAQSAQRWAEHLAQTGRFEHAPENRSAPEGENLWAGTKGYYTPEAMVDAWIREKRFFRPGVFPDNSVTGRVEDIGHYTQVVWRATREVGCAEAASASEEILVCRYAEAGNYRGEQPF